jgi:hypothetical protein
VLTLQYLINSPAVARLNLLLIGGWIMTVLFFFSLYNGVNTDGVPYATRAEVLFRFWVTSFSMLVSTYSRLMEVSPINGHLVRNRGTDGQSPLNQTLSLTASLRSKR